MGMVKKLFAKKHAVTQLWFYGQMGLRKSQNSKQRVWFESNIATP